VLIEAKSRLDPRRVVQSERRLQDYVLQLRAGLGLLIYGSATTEARGHVSVTPLVLSLPINDLLVDCETRHSTKC
jgi:hypothetical protein